VSSTSYIVGYSEHFQNSILGLDYNHRVKLPKIRLGIEKTTKRLQRSVALFSIAAPKDASRGDSSVTSRSESDSKGVVKRLAQPLIEESSHYG
jgi:hypothetical protein